MTIAEIYLALENQNITWNCHFGVSHEIGCPHKEWTKEQLLDALIQNKKFEQSGLRGETLT